MIAESKRAMKSEEDGVNSLDKALCIRAILMLRHIFWHAFLLRTTIEAKKVVKEIQSCHLGFPPPGKKPTKPPVHPALRCNQKKGTKSPYYAKNLLEVNSGSEKGVFSPRDADTTREVFDRISSTRSRTTNDAFQDS
jgi:hypothetical protein